MSDTTLNKFVGSGTAAQMAAHVPSPPTPASAPPSGYTFFNTTDGLLYAWNGAAWVSTGGGGGGSTVTNYVIVAAEDGEPGVMGPPGLAGAAAGGSATRAIGITIDGGGVAITTGIKVDVYVPYACTITAVTMLADQSGSIVVDIWKDTYANYPPTVADTITASAKPTISAATKSTDSTLTGWTTSVSASNTLRFNVDSAATITRLALVLTVTA